MRIVIMSFFEPQTPSPHRISMLINQTSQNANKNPKPKPTNAFHQTMQ